MRFLIHSIFYAPELTGIAKCTAEMCEWLAARGCEVEVVCPPPYYPHWKVQPPHRQWRYQREEISGVTVRRCPIWLPRRPGGLQRILYSLSFAASSFPALLGRLFRRPDAIFILEPSLLNAIPALILAKFTGALAWLHVQDFEIDIAFDLGQLRQPWLRSILFRFESWLMRRFDVVSTISQAMLTRAQAKGVPEDRLILFPNWVDTEAIHPLDGVSATRTELGISDETCVVLFSGTLGVKHGTETLIAAAKQLNLSHDDGGRQVLFLICGDGPAKSKLESLAAGLNNVRFLPLQQEHRLNDLLNAADIHALPQLPEVGDSVLPSKLLGMLASGRPVVASVRPESEVGRLLKNCGMVVPPGNAKSVADAICQLANNPELRRRLGAEARQVALRSFRKDVILMDFEQALLARLPGDSVAGSLETAE